ncbi:hypothetical protein ACFZDK_52070 [Streptomyces sp. NPDC007901]|uniref:hypothetical protein n=1 Tax=Streptomyces sp. NPDC007901 TaxID=3364785 RepID=UPI0036F07AB0
MVVSAKALFTLTDLCGLDPEDAIAGAVRTATALTRASVSDLGQRPAALLRVSARHTVTDDGCPKGRKTGGARGAGIRTVPGVTYLSPLGFLLAIEGAALLRGFQEGSADQVFVEARLAEIRTMLDTPALAHAEGVTAIEGTISTVDVYRAWAPHYDAPGNQMIESKSRSSDASWTACPSARPWTRPAAPAVTPPTCTSSATR